MKYLVIGASGFIGRNIVLKLKETGINPIVADRNGTNEKVDLLDRNSLIALLDKYTPDIIINAAGIVENSDKAMLNVEFTKNLLEAVLSMDKKPRRIIIIGSAAEYGEVDDSNTVISEEALLRPSSIYGTGKKMETELAMTYRKKYKLDIIVARVFNPIGPGMKDRFLITSILKQLKDHPDFIEINRLDSARDYIDVGDVANAIIKLTDTNVSSRNTIYNIGSGKSTSNKQLINTLLKEIRLPKRPQIIELMDKPEKKFAAKADISKIKIEFKWEPKISLKEATMEIINEFKNKS